MRLASAAPPDNTKVAVNATAKIADQIFIMSPLLFFEALQSLVKAFHFLQLFGVARL
jgi:hypothetical protein